jgi:hypothetical protein
MKNQFRVIDWSQDVTKYSEPEVFTSTDGQEVKTSSLPLEGSTTFKVELSQVDMSDVNQVVGTVYVKLNHLTEYTGEAKLEIEAKLAEQGLLEERQSTDLEQAKLSRWNRIIAIRDGLELKGFSYLGKNFDSDQRSTLRLFGAAQAAVAAKILNQEFSVDWTTADNTVITLSREEMIAAPAAMAVRVSEIHLQARELKERLDMAGSIVEVQSVLWPNVEIEIFTAV